MKNHTILHSNPRLLNDLGFTIVDSFLIKNIIEEMDNEAYTSNAYQSDVISKVSCFLKDVYEILQNL